jgi:hypothetical protein
VQRERNQLGLGWKISESLCSSFFRFSMSPNAVRVVSLHIRAVHYARSSISHGQLIPQLSGYLACLALCCLVSCQKTKTLKQRFVSLSVMMIIYESLCMPKWQQHKTKRGGGREEGKSLETESSSFLVRQNLASSSSCFPPQRPEPEDQSSRPIFTVRN